MQEVRFSPTHDIEASLLNIVKHRWPQASKILDLREDVFVDEDHKKLFQLFRTTQAENGLWDDNILRGKFEEMGGNLSTYNRVSVIANNPSNTDEYISQIIKGAKDRRLLEYLIHAQKSKDEPIDILKSAMEDLSQLDGMRQARVRGATIDEVAERFRNKEFPPKISSGIDTIDKLLGGISPEEVTTLGAPPGTGKSILAATIAANIAMDGGTSLIFSKEMLEEKIFSRLVATYSQERVGLYEDIKRGKVQGKEASSEVRKSLETIITMLANLRDYFMFFDMEDSPRMSPHEISEEIRAQNSVLAQWNKSNPHLMPRKIDFVVVDYLQILDYDKGNGSTSDDLDSLAKGLHDVALQQHCHILVLAAVNRALGKSLDLDAFRGSAGIGFNTDNALLMVANDDLNLSGLGSDWTGEYPKCKALTIHVAKARSGQTNARGYLKFSGLYQSFEEFEAQELAGLKAILGDEGSKQKREKIM